MSQSISNQPRPSLENKLSLGRVLLGIASGAIVLALVFMITQSTSTVTGHLGPAGVGNQSSNNIWFSLDSLNFSNGDGVSSIADISGNQISGSGSGGNRPLFSTYSVNGRSSLDFDGSNDIIKIPSSSKINQSGPYEAKTLVIAFQTGADVSRQQWLYEQGGNVRGMNFYIHNHHLYYGVYNVANDDATTPWSFTYVKDSVYPNQTYVAILTFDYLNDELIGYLNGVAVDTANGIGKLHTHPDACAFGGINGQSYDTNGAVNSSTGKYFGGKILEFASFEAVLSKAQRLLVENYLGSKFDVSLDQDLFTYDNSHNFEVSGIYKASDGTFDDDAQSTAVLRISNPSDLDNEEGIIWGHDGTDYAAGNTNEVDGTEISSRIDRTWKVNVIGSPGTVDVVINIAAHASRAPAGFYLVIDRNGDEFITSDVAPISGSYSSSAKTITFSGVSFQDGDVFTLGANDLSFPVEWLFFEASPVGREVSLEWATAREMNNDYFTLERMEAGQDFQQIGKVDAVGQSNSPTNYSFTDQSPEAGRNLYRLKQTDIDGAYTYAPIIEVYVDQYALKKLSLSPNPISLDQEVNITLEGMSEGNAIWQIMTINGQVVKQGNIEIGADRNRFSVGTSGMSKGAYLFQVRTQEEIQAQQLIIR